MRVTEHGIRLITSFEGKPRLKARRCEGDKYEVGYGCTYFPDGRKVKASDVITPDMVKPMLAHCMVSEMAPVARAFARDPGPFWYDAFSGFSFNVGGYNVVGEPAAALTLWNEGRLKDAAAAFVGWVSATSSGPTEKEQGDPYYAGVWEMRDGRPRWISPDGQPCKYRRKMRGLLRRRLAEGCLALGYDWEEACADDSVFLRRERVWSEVNKRWEDRTISMTQLKDVLPVAQKHPLEFAPEVFAELSDVLAAPPGDDGAERLPPVLEEEPMPTQTQPVKVVVHEEAIELPNLDPAKQPKRMEDSETHRGLSKSESGKEAVYGGTGVTLLAAMLPLMRELTGFFEQFEMRSILLTIFLVGITCIAVGGWRWWRGKIIAYEGRVNAREGKA